MSDYLDNIVSRTLNAVEVIEPRVPLLFESTSPLTPTPPQSDDSHGLDLTREPIRPRNEVGPGVSGPQTQPIESPKGQGSDDSDSKSSKPQHELGDLRQSPAISTGTPGEIWPPANVAVAARDVKLPPGDVELPRSIEGPGKPSQTGEIERRTIVGRPLTVELGPDQHGPRSLRTSDARALAARTTKVVAHSQEDNLIAPAAELMIERSVEQRESPTIKITIGRVDVRAIMPQAPPVKSTPVRPKPGLSLQDYLKQREEGKR